METSSCPSLVCFPHWTKKQPTSSQKARIFFGSGESSTSVGIDRSWSICPLWAKAGFRRFTCLSRAAASILPPFLANSAKPCFSAETRLLHIAPAKFVFSGKSYSNAAPTKTHTCRRPICISSGRSPSVPLLPWRTGKIQQGRLGLGILATGF